ncbi:MAG: PilZ domain-containing protein [Acidobacteriota bacterium]
MKPLAELTVADLAASPVWRYEGGDGPQALVTPVERTALSQSDDEIFLAATDFYLFDSSRRSGFCFPADDSGIDYLQPVIVAPSGHVSFWFDGPAAPEILASQWKALGKEPWEIFPVAFTCRVPVDGRTVTGRIERVVSSRDLMSDEPAPTIPEVGDASASDRIPTARPIPARRGTGAVEKRAARRRKTEMTVEFSQGALHGTGVIHDVSPRGMFVRSTSIPGTGPMLRLKVNLPEGRTLVLTGRVVRGATTLSSGPSSASGFGLRLAGESPEYEALLSRLRKR